MLERPTHGARVRFDRGETSGDGPAEYAVTVWLPDAELHLRVALTARGGAADFERTGGDSEAAAVEPWLDKYLQTMARQLCRAARGEEAWPRKLVQWHSPD